MLQKLWILTIVISCITGMVQPMVPIQAKEDSNTITENRINREQRYGCDIIFVLDISGSMNKTDTNGISLEIMKMIVDISSSSNNRIGFVAYNDTIAYSYELTEVNQETNAKKIKDYMSKVSFQGETDMGLGLKKAVDLLVNKFDSNRQPIVCLLSDGETNLKKSHTGRTEEDSEKDIQASIELAKQYEIPIYTVGLMNRFNSKVDYLEVISNQTEGKSYVATSPFQLLEIINGIFIPYQAASLKNETTVLSKGEIEEVTITLPNQYIERYAIVILASSNLKTSGILGTEKSKKNTENYYAIIEVEKPEQENVTIYYQAEKGASVSINTQAICNFNGKIEVEDVIYKKEKQSIRFCFLDKDTNEEIKDLEVYKSLECNVYLQNEETKERIKLSYGQSEDGLIAEYVFDQNGTYTLQVQYQSDFGSGYFESNVFEVKEKEAKSIDKIEAEICQDQSKQYDLNKLFENKLKTSFSFELEEVKGNNIGVQLNDNQLTLQAKELGKGTVSIIAKQGDDKYRLVIETSVQTFWEMYQEYIVGIAIISIIAFTLFLYIIISYIQKRRRKGFNQYFSGNLIGYFIDVKSANDMPPMKWELNQYPGVGITLNTLVHDAGIVDYFMGADRIWIYPKSDTEIEIVHSLKGSIFVGTKLIEKDIPTTVYSGETIYVCFEENGAEIELRYQATGGINP